MHQTSGAKSVVSMVFLGLIASASAAQENLPIDLVFLDPIKKSPQAVDYTFRLDGLNNVGYVTCFHLIAREASGQGYWPQKLHAPIDEFNPFAVTTVGNLSAYPLHFFIVGGDATLCGEIDSFIARPGTSLPLDMRKSFCPARLSKVFTIPSFDDDGGAVLDSQQRC